MAAVKLVPFRSTNRPLIFLIFLAVAQLVLAGWLYPAGHLTWDSGTYHLMAKTLLETGGFFIENGLEQFNAPLMRIGQTVIHNDSLVSQYPEIYTFIAAPFYAVFGFRGFTVLNSCALIAICCLIWRITPWFVESKKAQPLAVVIYLAASFAWEYSLSSYPHLTASLLILLSCWLCWSVFLGRPEVPIWLRNEHLRLLLGGLVFGLAIGVRLDSLFAGLALGLPLLMGHRVDWRRGCWIAIGLALPLAAMAWINWIKFGIPNPFSYGRPSNAGFTGNLKVYAPAMFAVLLLAIIFAYRDTLLRRFTRRKIFLFCIGLFAVICFIPIGVILSHPGYEDATFGKNLFQILIDLRIRPEIPEAGLTRSENGAMIYMGGVKQTLLQSMPYLILLLPITLVEVWRGKLGERYLLWLVPTGYVGVYGMLAWHGSVAQNMRYLNPILPFLALLTAREFIGLGFGRLPWMRVMAYSVLAWSCLCALVLFFRDSIQIQEWLFLDIPLIVALGVLVIWLLGRSSSLAANANKTLVYLLVMSMVWSSAIMFANDFFRSTRLRIGLATAAEHFLPQIERNAAVLTNNPDVIWPILDRGDKVLIATYIFGTCDQIKSLIQKFAGERPIYWIGTLDPPLKPDEIFCVPKKLRDGRAVTFTRPKLWDPMTDGLIYRIQIVG